MLYWCSTWALKKGDERKLLTTWRRMLRYVFRIHRRRALGSQGAPEDWIDFVRRSAHSVDALATRLGMENWQCLSRRKKWRFAGRVACLEDGRWTKKILDWTPSYGLGRSRQRPKTRWIDPLVKYAGGHFHKTKKCLRKIPSSNRACDIPGGHFHRKKSACGKIPRGNRACQIRGWSL